MPGGRFALLILVLVLLMAGIQLGVVSIAFERLGLDQRSAYLLLMTTLLGSMINVPLFSVEAERPDEESPPGPWRRVPGEEPGRAFEGRTVVAVNVGGAVTPVAFSFYLMTLAPLGIVPIVLVVGAVTAVAYLTSVARSGVGIAMPFLVAPLTAATAALLVAPEYSAPLAYIGGTLGVLIGADLLHIGLIRKLGAPVASIGGAGTFDGIFLSGMLAVLLA